MIRLIQRLLKYTSIKHIDYQLLIDSLGKLREIAKKLNEQKFLAAHHNYIEKFKVIELQQELTTIQLHLTRFLFSDCLEYMRKAFGMKIYSTYLIGEYSKFI
ncbi:unnamed protein product [Rotaria sordida]|uniref:Uncharacterized protein n=1 Tax=Rotaria sordida TaxID=392033 RepID=A0A815MVM9_9BILA|nr:unnamed protein product [Rotaria sordida]CAF1631206.1 unnamed protein product [Rotaria sordida]